MTVAASSSVRTGLQLPCSLDIGGGGSVGEAGLSPDLVAILNSMTL